MGEILFSLFIGGFLAGIGLLMNGVLSREQKRLGIEVTAVNSEVAYDYLHSRRIN